MPAQALRIRRGTMEHGTKYKTFNWRVKLFRRVCIMKLKSLLQRTETFWCFSIMAPCNLDHLSLHLLTWTLMEKTLYERSQMYHLNTWLCLVWLFPPVNFSRNTQPPSFHHYGDTGSIQGLPSLFLALQFLIFCEDCPPYYQEDSEGEIHWANACVFCWSNTVVKVL